MIVRFCVRDAWRVSSWVNWEERSNRVRKADWNL